MSQALNLVFIFSKAGNILPGLLKCEDKKTARKRAASKV
jgi:hypothetical protein